MLIDSYLFANFYFAYSDNYLCNLENLETGSSEVISSIKINTLVRSMCRRNYSPSPLFSCAPSTIPGISAIVILNSSTNLTYPTEGFKVVN